MEKQIYYLVVIITLLNLNSIYSMENNIKPEPKPDSIKSKYIPTLYAGVSPILEKKSKEYVKKELIKKYSNLTGKKNKSYGTIEGE